MRQNAKTATPPLLQIGMFGILPNTEYRMPYGDYDFEFTVTPIFR